MNKIDQLTTKNSKQSLEQLLNQVSSQPLGLPFNDDVVGFVGELSTSILTDPAYRQYPELLAMAHWFRTANLHQLKSHLQKYLILTNNLAVARGLVFHIAPANVDSIFVYSWLLSLLCANTNIVRVSQRRTPQMQAFFKTLNSLLIKENFKHISKGNSILSYDHDTVITAAISNRCQLRVAWGGDSAIKQVRDIPLPPLSMELVFADRFSLAVVNSEAIIALEERDLQELAHNFFNDAFWFNQQACSSPRAIVWIGMTNASEQAKALFWRAVSKKIHEDKPENSPSMVMDRTTVTFRYAYEHKGMKCSTRVGRFPARLHLDTLTNADRDCHDGNGLFIELHREKLEEIGEFLQPKDQTITYFGFEKEEWINLLNMLPPRTVDRIVPIGQALAFSSTWDGQNLIRFFTREIQIEMKR